MSAIWANPPYSKSSKTQTYYGRVTRQAYKIFEYTHEDGKPAFELLVEYKDGRQYCVATDLGTIRDVRLRIEARESDVVVMV